MAVAAIALVQASQSVPVSLQRSLGKWQSWRFSKDRKLLTFTAIA
ncbi:MULTISPECIES: hypothetical protein [Nostocales]